MPLPGLRAWLRTVMERLRHVCAALAPRRPSGRRRRVSADAVAGEAEERKQLTAGGDGSGMPGGAQTHQQVEGRTNQYEGQMAFGGGPPITHLPPAMKAMRGRRVRTGAPPVGAAARR